MQNNTHTSTGIKIDGRELASNILSNLQSEIEKLKKNKITPTLAIILIGEDKASESFIKQKKLKADEIGVEINLHKFDSITERELVGLIEDLNNDSKIHGIIVQRPLPKTINNDVIIRIINPDKDVDGYSEGSKFDAPVALAVIEILKSVDIENLNDQKIVVIGKGETAGGPIIKILDKKELIFEVIDSKSDNPINIIKNSDIVISAVGKENIVKPKYLNKNQILIGVGLTLENGKLIGDYVEDKIKDKVKFYTPRIGGVGPVNVALLMKNLITATKNYAA